MNIPAEIVTLTGISNEDVANKPTFKELSNKYLQIFNNSDIAGFNSNRFDIPILMEEFARINIDFEIEDRSIIDVMNIFHKMEPRNLSAAYKFYCNKSIDNAHTAEADTKATYEVLKAQIEKYENVEIIDKFGHIDISVKNDITELSKFTTKNNFADFVGNIAFNNNGKEIFNFGKHKGKIVSDVFAAEPQYYDWIMKSQFSTYTKKIFTKIYLQRLTDKLF